MRRATIREVAQRAGVSYQTVSRVINNHPMVAASTRALVRAAITELDYHPNAQAVGLSRNRADIIGVITHSIASPFFAQIVDGTAQALQAQGRFMLLGSANMTTQQETIDILLQRKTPDANQMILCNVDCDTDIDLLDVLKTIDVVLQRIQPPLQCPH